MSLGWLFYTDLTVLDLVKIFRSYLKKPNVAATHVAWQMVGIIFLLCKIFLISLPSTTAAVVVVVAS